MLGHHQPSAAPPEEPTPIDEDAEKIQELKSEFRVKELENDKLGA